MGQESDETPQHRLRKRASDACSVGHGALDVLLTLDVSRASLRDGHPASPGVSSGGGRLPRRRRINVSCREKKKRKEEKKAEIIKPFISDQPTQRR